MAVMLMVKMPTDEVADMITVLYRDVAAGGPVHVRVALMNSMFVGHRQFTSC